MGPGKSQPAITYILAIFLVIDPHITPPPAAHQATFQLILEGKGDAAHV